MTSTPRSRPAMARTRLGIALLALFVATGAVAKQSDRQQPMVVDNPGGSFDGYRKPNSVTTLKGPHVTITQGTLKVTGTLAKIYFDASEEINHVVVTGSPAHIEQLDDNGNLMTGNAANLDYDNIHGIATLTGEAVVKQQGRGEAHGDKLTYNTQTSEMSGTSGGNGQVHMVFVPKSKPAQPSAQDATAKPAASASAPAPASSAGAQP